MPKAPQARGRRRGRRGGAGSGGGEGAWLVTNHIRVLLSLQQPTFHKFTKHVYLVA